MSGRGRSGVAALGDKIVQRALVEVLNASYEQDFLGFSYGFRPGAPRIRRRMRSLPGLRCPVGGGAVGAPGRRAHARL